MFSFLELEDEKHHGIFHKRVGRFRKQGWSGTLDAFLHRDWIELWAAQIGFADVSFTDGTDASHHPPFWQALTAMTKPADDARVSDPAFRAG